MITHDSARNVSGAGRARPFRHRRSVATPRPTLLHPTALIRRVSWADLQLHRICTVSRHRSSRSASPSISDPAASRRFHSNT